MTDIATRILAIDDDASMRMLVRATLESADYDVIEADGGRVGVDLCTAERPDLVLLDVEMPGMDGHEAIALIRGDPEIADVPVLFLTARDGADDLVDGLGLGAQDYVAKPFEPKILLARVAAALAMRERHERAEAELERATAASISDPLTGLGNRRYLDELITILRADWEVISAVMIDIDHFKSVNDIHGHQSGDEVLRVVADRLRSCLEEPAEAGRYGGEEFLVVIPGASVATTHEIAERIRATIAATAIELGDGTSISVTVSAGGAQGPAGQLLQTVSDADRALYVAKDAGRNRVEISRLSADDDALTER